MAETKTRRWGDDVDDDDDESLEEHDAVDLKTTSGVSIPPTHTSRIDSKGIKIVTSYRAHPNTNTSQLIKTITKIRVTSSKVKEHVDVEKRRHWKKFGLAATDLSNVTIQSRDDVYLEDPNADTDLQDEDVTKTIAGNISEFWAKQQRRQLERKYDVGPTETAPSSTAATATAATAATEDGWHKVGDNKAGKYVPPAQRAGAGAGGAKSLAAMASRSDRSGDNNNNNRDQNTIRVTNISEDTSEQDLQQLFQRFGRISRVFLAKDKETMQSRGFAFVSFVHRDDAARAMEMLQGFGFNHLILKLEWARPSAPKDPAKEGTVFRSGYGKALAQDTKEKVTYASNLTR